MISTLSQMLDEQVARRPTKTAVIDGTVHVSYRELQCRSRVFAAKFRDAGVHHGDRVGIYLRRSIDAAALLFACWRIGAVAVPINDMLKSRQVKYIVSHAELSLLVTEQHLLDHFTEPFISAGRILLLESITVAQDGPIEAAVIDADLAMIIYTSGSTGMPKGIMLSHRNLLNGADIVGGYLHLSEHDNIISLLSFSFDYGLNQLLSSVLFGGTLVIERSTLAADICTTLVQERITGMAAVPMLWQQLGHPRSPFTKIFLPHLRYITNTGGRMPEHLTAAFRKAHPHVAIYLMFGLTEAFRSTYLPPHLVDTRPSSIGKAIPNVEILVLNEKGEPCGPDEPGELVHRGGTISLGYWRDKENTARRFRPAPFEQGKNGIEEIAVYSGDYVKKDAEGFLYYLGRMDQMMKSRGVRISPEEIEEYIQSSALVSHVVAFSVPKNDVESRIVAAVIPNDRRSFDENLLRLYCRREMPEYMSPEIFWMQEEFPLTSTGKPDRIGIKEAFLHHRTDHQLVGV